MPIVNAPLEMLAAFLIVCAISALFTMVLSWFVERTARNASRRYPMAV